MKSNGRIAWFAPGDLDGDARALYDSIASGPRAQGRQDFPLADEDGRLHGPFNAMLVSPEVGTALQELGTAIRYRSSLTARVRELAILEVARIRRSDFEWYAHARVGRQIGLTEDELAALHDGTAAPTLDPAEAVARTAVRTFLETRDLDDAVFAAAKELLGDREVMELIALTGYYDLLALSLRVWRTPLPPGLPSPF